MLKQLRRRLVIQFALATGLVLALLAAAGLISSEAQTRRASLAAFQSNINAVVTKLQNDRSVSSTWLAQTEAAEGLIIHIEDNGRPIFFRGSWQPLSSREELVALAQKTALEQYATDVNLPPSSLLETDSTVFALRGSQGERYLAGVARLPSVKGRQSLTLLRDLRNEDREIWKLRLLFLLFVAAGIGLLILWSRYFVGRLLRPIEESRKKQVGFVAAASHELRSPLAVIRASASAVRAGGDAAPFCDNIERECARMGRLVEDLLLLAGSDAQTWSVTMRPVDTDVLLVETAELFYPVAAKRRQQLTLCLPDESLPEVNGDEQRLRQVLSVLLDNALSYTPEDGAVTLRARAAGKTVSIEVCDTGKGIPSEHAPHIFERFYRADQSRNDKSHFGLGLSIAQELVRLHHGRLSLKSTGPKGTIFSLELPIAE